MLFLCWLKVLVAPVPRVVWQKDKMSSNYCHTDNAKYPWQNQLCLVNIIVPNFSLLAKCLPQVNTSQI